MDLLTRVRALPVDRRTAFIAGLSKIELRELGILTQSLLNFMPEVSPGLVPPRHLQRLVDLFERVEREPLQITLSTPPQHGKTELGLHALVWMLRRNPHKRHAYVTYAADRAQAMSRKAQQIARAAGLKFSGTLKMWVTPEGGGIIWTGIGGPLTGFGIDGLLLVDDPVKNRAEAESKNYRDGTDEWFRDVALTRLHPGASVLVVQTRWHEDDLSGRLNKRGWPKVNLPAVDEDGKALWEEKRPLAWLIAKRVDVGEYTWASLFQGEPRPRGGAVFGDVHLCEEVPELDGYRIGIGVDLAYTATTQSDWSVALAIGRDTRSAVPRYVIFEVVRRQVKAPDFKKDLRTLAKRYPGTRMRWYASGTEQGAADFIKEAETEAPGVKHPRIPLEVIKPKGDKFVRAQSFAAAWNAGRVLVPRFAAWADKLITELAGFTGLNDAEDDQVDAGAAGFDLVAGAPWSSNLDAFPATKPKMGPHELNAGSSPLGGMKDAPDHSGDADRKKITSRI